MKYSRSLIPALTLLAALPLTARADDPPVSETEKRLERQVELMQQQLDAMKAELRQMKAENQALATAEQQLAAQAVEAAPAAGTPGVSKDLSLWGYGEVYYTHPVHDPDHTEFDLARAVFGIGYHFDERTVFNSEFEVEHAVASASDRGEFEVEQFYVDHQLSPTASIKAGLFLMPFGLLNEHHEPTNFYGVQRNFVETLVIPSTWREGGVGVHGHTNGGIRWDAGITTGLNLEGWNPNPEDPLYRTALDLEDNDVAPMQATHQELQLANARNLSQYLSVGYDGIPGLTTGAAVFTGRVAVPAVPAGLPATRATLWEAHLRWTPGAADLSALVARGTLSNTARYNLDNTGVANPLPAAFQGYYVQGAYTVWEQDGYRFAPFLRWEHYDMGSAYEGIAPGFTVVPTGLAADGKPWPQPNDRVWTAGANFWVTPHVVLKADYQHFAVNTDFTRVDLGLGLSF